MTWHAVLVDSIKDLGDMLMGVVRGEYGCSSLLLAKLELSTREWRCQWCHIEHLDLACLAMVKFAVWWTLVVTCKKPMHLCLGECAWMTSWRWLAFRLCVMIMMLLCRDECGGVRVVCPWLDTEDQSTSNLSSNKITSSYRTVIFLILQPLSGS